MIGGKPSTKRSWIGLRRVTVHSCRRYRQNRESQWASRAPLPNDGSIETEPQVERQPAALGESVAGLNVIGEATDDGVLRQAGVERASGLVVALNSDADNTYVTLSGRSLNPNLFIVTRANSAAAEPKLRQAGANRVVNPHEIGGNRMAAFMMQPNVADFLGEAMHDGRIEVKMAEFEVEPGSTIDGASIEGCGLVRATGVSVLAIKRSDGSFVHSPDPSTTFGGGDVPIVLGTSEQHYALRAWLAET